MEPEQPQPHPIRLVVEDDLRRSRLTVFFRLLLALPHIVWILLWTLAAVVAILIAWVAALAIGRVPGGLHRFLAAYVRYATHVTAYLYLAANPFPGFLGRPGSYPVDVVIPEPERQRRWTILFRLFLALPAILLSAALAGTGGSGGRGDDGYASAGTGGAMSVAAFLGWFASLVRGRMPSGLRGLLAYAIRYSVQAYAYLFLLTDRYPDADPAEPALERPLDHPIQLAVADDLDRSRLTVFFRLPLVLPHAVWLALWGIAALLAAVASWLATLVMGRSPTPLHRFLAAYLRYWSHVASFLYLVAHPFPGFTGRAGSYPVELEPAAPARQNRWVTGFRLVLAVPALLLAAALGSALAVSAFLAWFYSLVRGRTSPGLRNLGAYVLRYMGQVYAYLLLLTDRYPHSAPPA